MTSGDVQRYADLTGKTVVVAGESALLVAVVRAFAGNGMLIAVAAADRGTVAAAVQAAEELGAMVMGVTTDPASRQAWERLRPQAEQRLGPIDIAVAIGPPSLRHATAAALVPDMAARRRGVVIEVDDVLDRVEPLGGAVRHYGVASHGEPVRQIVERVVGCASDTAPGP